MLIRLRRALRSAVPEPLRIGVALLRRRGRDVVSGQRRRFVRQAGGAALPCEVAMIRQDIRQSALWQGKLANLQLGAARIDGAVLAPGAVFSFWELVGRPSVAAGFALGRAFRGEVPGGDIGGGLCQLSGIAYELGLRAGLAVVERHPHSRDLYAEADRFTPLGLDATVVWPWKDLRLRNDTGAPLCLCFAVEGLTLRASAHAALPGAAHELAIDRQDAAGIRHVAVSRITPARQVMPVSRDSYVVEAG